MKIEKLRVGTKVKILSDRCADYNCRIGDVAFITSNSSFHSVPDSVFDRGGDIWVTNDKITIAIKRVCFTPKELKILKY